MNGLIDPVRGLFQALGRYFSIVSLVPGILLIVNILFLAGITQGMTIHLLNGLDYIAQFGAVEWIAILGASAAIGLLVHPLQYALTQLFEGYWGPGLPARRLAEFRIVAHRNRAARLEGAAVQARADWVAKAHHSRPAWFRQQLRGHEHAQLRSELALERLHSPDVNFLIPAYNSSEACFKALERFPQNHGRILPTRLGNILRRHEDRIGSVYGLDAVAIAPYLTQVAKEPDVVRVADEGEQLDLCLRLCLVFMFTTVVYAVWLAHFGPWAALSLVPYGCAYAAYRGACIAAENYMSAFAVLLHLNRFALYEALHLESPHDLKQERDIAEHVMDIVNDASPTTPWIYDR